MNKGLYEEWRRVKTDFSLVIAEMVYGWVRLKDSPVLVELMEAEKEFKANQEIVFHFEWKIVDADESHIYVTNKTNSHRYHISVIYPAALYVDVYRILDDGTEVDAFGEENIEAST